MIFIFLWLRLAVMFENTATNEDNSIPIWCILSVSLIVRIFSEIKPNGDKRIGAYPVSCAFVCASIHCNRSTIHEWMHETMVGQHIHVHNILFRSRCDQSIPCVCERLFDLDSFVKSNHIFFLVFYFVVWPTLGNSGKQTLLYRHFCRSASAEIWYRSLFLFLSLRRDVPSVHKICTNLLL